jgi:tetratricopeptide (TPR) repeat protein
MGTLDELRSRARSAVAALQGRDSARQLLAARGLLEELRNATEYEALSLVAEAVSRVDSHDPKTRRLYAQALIETGKASVAVDVLQALAARLPNDHPEALEAAGLLGRAYKQIFFDAADHEAPAAREAWRNAIAIYRKPYEANRANTWHGTNLLALAANAARCGVGALEDLDVPSLAQQLYETLQARPVEQRDAWHLPTLAEVSLGLGNWTLVERTLREYLASENVPAFQLQSTLRQFTRIWQLDPRPGGTLMGAGMGVSRGRAIINMLRARLMQRPDGAIDLSPGELQSVSREPTPDNSQLEAVLGEAGPKTYKWWKLGLQRAMSVAAIRHNLAGRVGTGFVVRAQDLGLTPGEELLVLTNFHVVNEHGTAPGIRPAEAEVVLEAADANRVYSVAQLLWSSPVEQCDASLLRLAQPIVGVEPIPLAAALPIVDTSTRVYVVGHPGGRDLSFSFQDNELLDHEGPPQGKPQFADVCRVHYRAPTEGGSSGSPVFNGDSWQVIALHHKGGKRGMPRLNGLEGTYAANEGIALASIRAWIAR